MAVGESPGSEEGLVANVDIVAAAVDDSEVGN